MRSLLIFEICIRICNTSSKISRSITPTTCDSISPVSSSSCAYHPSINFTNVGKLTIPQLYDNFQRILIDRNYQIMALNASVWGTEGSDFKEDSYLKNLKEEK